MFDHPSGCSCCDAALNPTDFDVRSAAPDPILALSEQQRSAVWGGRNLMQADGVGAFARCLMPVLLSDCSRVTYSAWLSVHPDQLGHAYRVWDDPEYAQLALSGVVANAIKPWPGISGEPATAEVRAGDDLPYLVAQEGTLLWRVLNEEWDRDEVLSLIWHPLPTTVRQRFTEEWSVSRTAGMAPRMREGEMAFVGSGRTVRLEAFGMPADAGAEGAIAMLTPDLPERRDGEATEREGVMLRYAFWLTATVDERTQHELYGFAAVPGAVAAVTCIFDDPADLLWAQATWRSLRHHS